MKAKTLETAIAMLIQKVENLETRFGGVEPPRMSKQKTRGRPQRKPGEKTNCPVIFCVTPTEKNYLEQMISSSGYPRNKSKFIRKALGLES